MGLLHSIDKWCLREHRWTTSSWVLPPGRWISEFAICYLCNRLIFVGGRHHQDITKKCWSLDVTNPQSAKWEEIPSLPQPQFGMATLVWE
jgi:hypothetical protein